MEAGGVVLLDHEPLLLPTRLGRVEQPAVERGWLVSSAGSGTPPRGSGVAAKSRFRSYSRSGRATGTFVTRRPAYGPGRIVLAGQGTRSSTMGSA